MRIRSPDAHALGLANQVHEENLRCAFVTAFGAWVLTLVRVESFAALVDQLLSVCGPDICSGVRDWMRLRVLSLTRRLMVFLCTGVDAVRTHDSDSRRR